MQTNHIAACRARGHEWDHCSGCNVCYVMKAEPMSKWLYFLGTQKMAPLKVYTAPWVSTNSGPLLQPRYLFIFIYWIRNKHSALINNEISSLAWIQELEGLIYSTYTRPIINNFVLYIKHIWTIWKIIHWKISRHAGYNIMKQNINAYRNKLMGKKHLRL